MISFSLRAPTFNLKWWEESKHELSQILDEENRQSWTEETDPQTNRKWTPLSTKYRSWKEKAYPNSSMLRLSGQMQDGTRIRPLNGRGLFSAKMGASYGAYHMSGTSRMPSRPWLGVPISSIPKMEAVIAKTINKGKILRGAPS
jgi:hypothetical protein